MAVVKKRVLLIEPDKVLADAYMSALKRAGFACTWETDAQAAILAMDKHKPDVITLEVQLKKHNGVEFLNELRSYPDLQKVPVVLLTLVPMHDLALTDQQRTQLGIAAYCYKPRTSLDVLVSTVAEQIT